MGHSPVMAHVMLNLRFTYCIAYISVADPGEGSGGARPPLIFRPKENIFWRPAPHYLRVWMTAPPPPTSRYLSRSGSGTVYQANEARLILQSGIYIFCYQYFGRHGLPSSEFKTLKKEGCAF